MFHQFELGRHEPGRHSHTASVMDDEQASASRRPPGLSDASCAWRCMPFRYWPNAARRPMSAGSTMCPSRLT